MADPSLAAVLDRLDRLEREGHRLRRRFLWWRRFGLLAAFGLIALALGLPGRPAATLAQERERERAEVPGSIPPQRPEPIHLGLGTKVIESESYLLRNEEGALLATVVVNQDGTPTIGLHARDQGARLFLRIDPDGEPGIIFFDRNGRRPVEMVVARDGAGSPSLKVIERSGQSLFSRPRARP